MESHKREKISKLLKSEAGTEIVVKGWVRTKRGNKNIVFDMTQFTEEQLKPVTTGSCISVLGTLTSSPGGGQAVEIQAKELNVYGTADPETYPLQKKGHSMEFLREIGHLRPRTNTFGCIFRIRHAMSFAIHKFFND